MAFIVSPLSIDDSKSTIPVGPLAPNQGSTLALPLAHLAGRATRGRASASPGRAHPLHRATLKLSQLPEETA